MKTRIHPRLARLGWNRRVLTYQDFEQACERDAITLIVRPFDAVGEYKIAHGHDFITLDSRLCDPFRTLVAFHEYAHCCWHVPGRHGLLSKTEWEADVVAIVALLPRPLLLRLSPGEISEALGYPLAFIAQRYQIWLNLRI